MPVLQSLLPFLLIIGTATAAPNETGIAFFETKIRPLLAGHCLECHSTAKKTRGGLNLDSRQGWVTGGDSGPAVIPGDPDASLLIKAVRYHDLTLQMPEDGKLPEAEITALETWVRLGAPDPRTTTVSAKKQTGLSLDEGRKFWSYAPLRPPAARPVQNQAWPWTELDHLLLGAAEKAGFLPAPDAPPETLARRLHLNLTGLPPSPTEIDRFVAAAREDRKTAIATLVDELLASRHFGEHWARLWLDMARFAESSGGGRTLLFKDAWRYRDYVIESLNADRPLDQFIREQIAGDLLPAADPAARRRQTVATAFLALGPTNYEEQDKQQLRFDIIDEQLDTIGRALLGQTLGCARCHDHKFDPIPQRDYYALAGILASTQTLFNYTDNVARWIDTPLPLDGPAEAALQAHQTKVEELKHRLQTAKAALTKRTRPVSVGSLAGIVIDDPEAKVVGNWQHSTFSRGYIGSGYLHDGNEGKGTKTITFTPSFPQMGRYEARLAYNHAETRARRVRVTVLHADGEETVFVDQTVPPPIDGRFVSLGTYRFEKDGAGFILIGNAETDGVVTVDALQLLPEDGAAPAPESNAADALVRALEAELKQLVKTGPVRPVAMSVQDAQDPSGTPIRIRGIEKNRGETIPRGFLQVIDHGPARISEAGSGRRELADWIAGRENPLTSRVLVNRVWARLFGSGIVPTVDNFGTTGDKPSDPELLDHLALRFLEDGWSLKRLVRGIVLSRAWQTSAQGSTPPEFFVRAQRRRLDAEQLRDAILLTGGRLQLDYLGPNIQGAGGIDANNTSAQNVEYAYVYADTRRSVYTPAFRNNRLEMFAAFDFADINASIGRRHSSTVAPQALFLLNHPFVLEHARAAAESTRALVPPEQLDSAFRRTLGRPPLPPERAACQRFLGPSPSTEDWAQLHQMLFASLDFRYVD